MKYTVSAITHPGKVRKNNQDNFYCEGCMRDLEHGELRIDLSVDGGKGWAAAVFDGMGGEKYGEVASLIAAKVTHEMCAGATPPYDINTLINYTNSKICSESESRMCSMGSTCVYLEFEAGKCRCWNLGDSRAYLLHAGAMEQLSEDHTEASSFRAIFGDDAVFKGNENRLTQHLGIPADEFIIEPYVSEWYAVEPGDILLMCSDGLTHLAGDADICAVLTGSASLQDKREQLLDLALGLGGSDNITVMIIGSES